MKSLKVNVKLLLSYIVIWLLLAVGVIYVLANLFNIRKKIESLYNESYVVKNAVNTVDTSFEAMQKSIFRSISNDSPNIINQEIADAKDCIVVIQMQVIIIRQNLLGNMNIVARLEKNLSKLEPMQEHVLNLIAQNKNSEAAKYMENNNIPVIKEAQKELVLLIQAADAKKNEIITLLQKTRRNTTILLVSLGIISILSSIKGGIYIRNLHI